MAKKLTEKSVARLSARRDMFVIWDALATGLGVKVTPAGRKLWIVQLVYPGQRTQSRRTLGKYPEVGLEDARERAKQWRGWVQQGNDPADEEEAIREAREAERRAKAAKRHNTFRAVVQKYLADRAHQRRARVNRQEIDRELVSAWGDKPIASITPRDVRELIEKLIRRAPFSARNAWTHLTGIFKQVVFDGLLEASPAASLDRRMLFRNARIAPRQRVFSDEELRAFWVASGRLDNLPRAFYRLLALTGTRLRELSRAKWSELHPEVRRELREAGGRPVDWAQVHDSVKLWTIPRERFKSDAEHYVPLSDDALCLIETLPRFAGCDYWFSYDGKNAANNFANLKTTLDKGMLDAMREQAAARGDDPEKVTLGGWQNHDLRRCLRSGLAALGVADHIAEMCLGHGRRGIQRVYDQHKYLAEKRAALEAWAARLTAIVGAPTTPSTSSENVVALKRRARR